MLDRSISACVVGGNRHVKILLFLLSRQPDGGKENQKGDDPPHHRLQSDATVSRPVTLMRFPAGRLMRNPRGNLKSQIPMRMVP